ncbi:MAG: 4'-phosphopantetheinyl transferase superfamily protein [Propionibacteriaceae bacterium]|nr:4'-phosphopantetheinyl transferase superfamily protein [Propionibacteriaceae bacterium]
MIRGIGLDCASISETGRLIRELGETYTTYAFTEAEIDTARSVERPDVHFAVRFAVKEAVYKAIAHLTPAKHFDLRIVETLVREDGTPYVSISQSLEEQLASAGVRGLHLTVSHGQDLAFAFVVATDE